MVQGHALRGPKSTDQKNVRSHRPFSDQAPPCGDRVLEERKIEAGRIPPSERGRGQTIFQGRLEGMRVEDCGFDGILAPVLSRLKAPNLCKLDLPSTELSFLYTQDLKFEHAGNQYKI